MNNTYFFTGFPGFLATYLVKEIIRQYPSANFILLVHPSQVVKAEKEIAKFIALDVGTKEQFELIQGDITKEGLAITEEDLNNIKNEVNYVFHLAAIYDLAVPKDLAYQVNVIGTRNVNDWVKGLNNLQRYVYFSTAYVSGTRTGRIYETELVENQGFKNHYEQTKYEAEKLVQQIMSKIPTTIIRPGIVMGNSKTGETVKFDGPYFVMRFLDKFSKFPIPQIGKGEPRINLVPVDYLVDATIYLAHAQTSKNKVYHLTDPNPYKVREVYKMICKHLLGKKPSWTIPTSLVAFALSITPFRKYVKVEKETIAYFKLIAEYDNSQAKADLEAGGITCPDFAAYIKNEIDYYKEHRNDPDKMIMIR